ncbi:nuclear transport factor 2 family protein [Ferruginibacter sp.]
MEAAMQKYDALILRLDADAISKLFTADGKLGNIATGRDSIKKFLSSFKNVQVLSQHSSTTSINIIADTATQNGIYHQTDVVNNRDTVTVKGEFTARWLWINKKGWFIQQMETKPTQ